ncbi:hypothetical protein CEXT_456381 [Caerostris extrusa]|uniref:Pre-C2HC domain-containing protein n=1 Tax=Caerostris extrusa TaxID=172846 RepID=A0AAV4UZ99_CAEEX|nr:hypothetical protein CEXT_456381 [Caerostris extrusa]
MQSVLSRDKFLKLTVSSEIEHLRLKNKLVQLGFEFKCFNLKQDRPLKVLIRGLPSCTSKEAIGSAITALGHKWKKKAQKVPPKNANTYVNKPMQIPPTQDSATCKQPEIRRRHRRLSTKFNSSHRGTSEQISNGVLQTPISLY